MVTNINFLLTLSIQMSRDKVMRIDKNNDHQSEIGLIFYKILSTHSLKRCMEVSLENLYVDIGA